MRRYRRSTPPPQPAQPAAEIAPDGPAHAKMLHTRRQEDARLAALARGVPTFRAPTLADLTVLRF